MNYEQTQPRGNGTRLLIIAIAIILGIATGAWDIVLAGMLVCLLVSNWLSDQAVKRLPSVKTYGKVRSYDLPFNDRAVHKQAEMRRSEPEPEPVEPHTNATERPEPAGTGSFVLTLTDDEVQWIQRMIIHRATAEKPSKASTIYAGNSSKKGGSAKYQRASELYDLLFAEPEKEPDMPLVFNGIEKIPMTYPVSRADEAA